MNARVSDALPYFIEGFHKRLKAGYDYTVDAPMFFVGVYDNSDYQAILRHKSHKVIIFCGSDAFNLHKKPFNLRFLADLSHSNTCTVVSISDDIKQTLESHGIKSVRFNVCPTDEDRFKVSPMSSDYVYVYYNPVHATLFDWVVYDEVVRHFGIRLRVHDVHNQVFVNPLDMPMVYEGCCFGLKPYLRDGFGNTQIELALSGRGCFSNGAFSGNLRYDSVQDVLDGIERLLNSVNDLAWMNELRTLAVKEIQLPTGFNEIEFWNEAV